MRREKIEECKERARKLVENMTVEEAASQLKYDAPAINRLAIPAYNWWSEALHGIARAGTATVYPQAIALAAMFDEEELFKIADEIATETRAKYNAFSSLEDRDIYKGLTVWSPNLNIFRDPRWGRGQETYGEDPYLTKTLGVAFIKGLQGEGEYLKTAACAKHFAVHSGPEALRHEFDAKVSQKDLRETYLSAFEAAVTEGGVESVMGAYNRTNGEPCCGSKTLLVDILRGEWKFEGHIVSDCWAIADFHMHHGITSTAPESAALAIKNGCDLNCGNTYLQLLMALKQGLITEEDIKEAAVHLFTTRMKLGMFSEDCEYDSISYLEIDTKEHRESARRAAQKAMVLLKNDGILPIQKKTLQTVAVIGPVAESKTVLHGNYNGDSSRYITLLAGLQDVLEPEVRVLYSSGCHLNKEREDGLAKPGCRLSEAISAVRNSDITILCVGIDGTMEGEEGDQGNTDASGDKTTLLLPKSQQLLCEKVLAEDKPVILVVTGGSSLDLSAYEPRAAAILFAWYSGEEGGHALADLLLGESSPSGRLPVTFYYETNSIPAFTDYSMKGRTYRYLTEKPWFPFGYGLSYTKFEYQDLIGEWQKEGLELSVRVKNIGERGGDEIVEAYIRYDGEDTLQGERFSKPNYSLKYFKRLSLKSGEERKISFLISTKELESVLEDGTSTLLEGTYTVFVGGNGPDERSVELTGNKPLEAKFQQGK